MRTVGELRNCPHRVEIQSSRNSIQGVPYLLFSNFACIRLISVISRMFAGSRGGGAMDWDVLFMDRRREANFLPAGKPAHLSGGRGKLVNPVILVFSVELDKIMTVEYHDTMRGALMSSSPGSYRQWIEFLYR